MSGSYDLEVTACTDGNGVSCTSSNLNNINSNNVSTDFVVAKSETGVTDTWSDPPIGAVPTNVLFTLYHDSDAGVGGSWSIPIRNEAASTTYCTLSTAHQTSPTTVVFNLSDSAVCTDNTWTNAELTDLEIAFISGDDKGSTDSWVLYTTLNFSYNAPPSFSVNLNSNSSVYVGEDIIFNATGTDVESDNYNLTVCSSDSLSGGVCVDTTYCTSSLVSSGSVASCSYTTTADGSITGYGFLCDSLGSCGTTSTTATTTVSKLPSEVYLTIDYPTNGLEFDRNQLFFLNGTLTCGGDSSYTCSTINYSVRYNSSGSSPDTYITNSTTDTPFRIMSSSKDRGFQLYTKDLSPIVTVFAQGIEYYNGFIYTTGGSNKTLFVLYENNMSVQRWFSLDATPSSYNGVTHNNTHVFVVSQATDRVYVYLDDGTYQTDFALPTGNNNPTSIDFNGTHLLTTDYLDSGYYWFGVDGSSGGFVSLGTMTSADRLFYYEGYLYHYLYTPATIDKRYLNGTTIGTELSNVPYLYGVDSVNKEYFVWTTNAEQFYKTQWDDLPSIDGGDSFNISFLLNVTTTNQYLSKSLDLYSDSSNPSVADNNSADVSIILNVPPTTNLDKPTADEIIFQFPYSLNASTSSDAGSGIKNASWYYYNTTDSSWYLIGSDVVPFGGLTYSWFTGIPDERYLMRVNVTDNGGNVGSDEHYFLLDLIATDPTCTVGYPNGGETVSGTIEINATAYDPDPYDNITNMSFSYSKNNGAQWNLIGTNLSLNLTTYTYQWDTTGDTGGANYLIRCNVTDTRYPLGYSYDDSDAVFTVSNGGVDTSFTVSLPMGYSTLDFSSNNKTVINLDAGGQNSTVSALEITNTGNQNLNFSTLMNATISGFTVFFDTDNDPSGATILSAAYQLIASSIGPASSSNVWYWTNWTDETPQTIQRELNVSTEIS